MLGFSVTVYREPEDFEPTYLGQAEPTWDLLLHWDAPLFGLRWLEEAGAEAALLAINGGYPIYYRVSARTVQAFLAEESHMNRLKVGEDWSNVDPSETLILEAWDQS